jgi:hypothetical protein
MNTNTLYFFFALLITAFLASAPKQADAQNLQFQGFIASDTTWQADTLEITGNVLIDNNVVLTIMPGTFVHILGYFAIESYGTVRAIGTPQQPIVFTHLNTLYHDDTSTVAGGWHGIRFLPRSAPDTSFFSYCTISNGKAVVPGSWGPYYDNPDNIGANVYAKDFGSIVFEHCYIANGRAKGHGAGLHLENGNSVLIDSCHFQYNHTYTTFGGGVNLIDIQLAVVRNSLFDHNTAYYLVDNFEGGAGSGIAVQQSWGMPTFTQIYTLIENNRFFNSKASAGAIYESCPDRIDVIGNVISNNYGNGIANGHSAPTTSVYANNTIVNNKHQVWGGVYSASPHLRLINNIIWWNYKIPGILDNQIYSGNFPPPIVRYCNVQNGFPGEGNIADEPLFVSPSPGQWPDYDGLLANWSLLDNSPGINFSDPDTINYYTSKFDLHGNPRIFGGRIDMGAYENQNVWVSLPQNPLVNARLLATPNPFRNAFTVELFGPEKVKRITVYNQTGTPVRQMETLWHEGLVSIDMSGFAAGLYVLTVEYENGTVKTEKMVKL